MGLSEGVGGRIPEAVAGVVEGPCQWGEGRGVASPDDKLLPDWLGPRLLPGTSGLGYELG